MRDWNDTQTVLFVVVRVTVHILKRQALGFTGSTLIPMTVVLTSRQFCLRLLEMITNVHMGTSLHLLCLN